MILYFIEPRTTKYVKRCRNLSFAGNLSNKNGKNILDTPTKTGVDDLKTFYKKIAQKTAEATREFIGFNIADKFVKPRPLLDENSKNVKKIVIPPEK